MMTPGDARMKVIDPLLSTGPSRPVQVLRCADSEMWIRVPLRIFVGATVHLRSAQGIFVGEVRGCEATDTEHEIHVRINESL